MIALSGRQRGHYCTLPSNQTMTTNRPDAGRISLPQDKETPLKSLNTPLGTMLYLYNRSSDSIDAHTVGQDYVSFRFDNTKLTFAVCDGVGQSFIGDLAARLLGDYLVDWLWELARLEDEATFAAAITKTLDEYTSESGQEVADYQLPDSLPLILKQALEMQREYGSEAMFVAGRISPAKDDDPGWVALAWLGDAPVAAIDVDGELVDLGPHGSTSERWNATTGIKGQVHTWISDAANVARVAGYTDGLGVTHVPKDADLAAMVERWVHQPPIDDASLFDVRLGVSPETVSEFERRSVRVKRAKERLNTGTEKLSRDPIILGDGTNEPVKEQDYAPDTARPIPVPDPEQPTHRPIESAGAAPASPVSDVKPLTQKEPDAPITGEWRPLGEKSDATPAKAAPKPLDDVRTSLAKLTEGATALDPKQLADVLDKLTIKDPTKKQQVEMWQQAALLGLTSAALALLMVERLLDND